jgi:hypothetical protein
MTTVRPTFIVHSLAHAEAALAAAAEVNVAVCLRSAEGAALSLGAACFRSMIAMARSACPQADAIALLDCGHSPGAALAALAAGVTHICGDFPDAVRSRIDDIARQSAATLLPQQMGAPSIDLAAYAEPQQICRKWLKTARNEAVSASKRELPSLHGSCNKFGAFPQESGEIEA